MSDDKPRVFTDEERARMHASLDVLLGVNYARETVLDRMVRYTNRDANWVRSKRLPPGAP